MNKGFSIVKVLIVLGLGAAIVLLILNKDAIFKKRSPTILTESYEIQSIKNIEPYSYESNVKLEITDINDRTIELTVTNNTGNTIHFERAYKLYKVDTNDSGLSKTKKVSELSDTFFDPKVDTTTVLKGTEEQIYIDCTKFKDMMPPGGYILETSERFFYFSFETNSNIAR